jgi:hypothetical protein
MPETERNEAAQVDRFETTFGPLDSIRTCEETAQTVMFYLRVQVRLILFVVISVII